MLSLNRFVNENKSDMLAELNLIVKELKADIASNPEEYTDFGCDEPTIDVRLCVDLGDSPSWLFRTGLSDFDQRHSEFCAASCVSTDTVTSDLLEELIDQLYV